MNRGIAFGPAGFVLVALSYIWIYALLGRAGLIARNAMILRPVFTLVKWAANYAN